MKASVYNITFEDNGSHYVYNAFLNSFARTNQEINTFLKAVERDGMVNGDVAREALAPLKKGGFLIADSRDELAELKLRNRLSRYSSSSFGITFAPTLNCNFNCSYCFESPRPEIATQQTVDALYDFVAKSLKNKSSFGVCWYGGEPLLAFDTIHSLSKRFISHCQALDIPYEADIISNGYLMTEERARVLTNDLQVGFWQVTLDGPPPIHDKRRPLLNGKGSFATILKNLVACHGYFDRVSVRINVDKSNHDQIDKLLDILADNGLREKVSVYFGRVQSFAAVCKSAGASCLSLEDFSAIESELTATALTKGFEVNTRPMLMTGYCGADRTNSFVVDPGGNLSKCWNCIGIEEEKVGTVFDDQLNDLYVQWLSFDPFLDQECLDCKILPLCMGGCPYEKVINRRKECKPIKHNLVQQLRHRQKWKEHLVP